MIDICIDDNYDGNNTMKINVFTMVVLIKKKNVFYLNNNPAVT